MEEENLLDLINGGNKQFELVMSCNQYTQQFGLSLTKEDALILVKDRKDTLKEHQRVEFGEGILPKLIFTFCDSPYIYQENYVDTIGKLQDIFYLYKNESLDELTDDELVDYMKKSFEGECQGSLEYLEDTALDRFARKIRQSTRQFIGRYQEDDEMNPLLLQVDGYEEDEDDE